MSEDSYIVNPEEEEKARALLEFSKKSEALDKKQKLTTDEREAWAQKHPRLKSMHEYAIWCDMYSRCFLLLHFHSPAKILNELKLKNVEEETEEIAALTEMANQAKKVRNAPNIQKILNSRQTNLGEKTHEIAIHNAQMTLRQECIMRIMNQWYDATHLTTEQYDALLAAATKGGDGDDSSGDSSSGSKKINWRDYNPFNTPAQNHFDNIEKVIEYLNTPDFLLMRRALHSKRMSQLFVLLIGGFFVVSSTIGTGGLALPFWFMAGLAAFGGAHFFKMVHEKFHRGEMITDIGTANGDDKTPIRNQMRRARNIFLNTTGIKAVLKTIYKVLKKLAGMAMAFGKGFGTTVMNSVRYTKSNTENDAKGGTTIKKRKNLEPIFLDYPRFPKSYPPMHFSSSSETKPQYARTESLGTYDLDKLMKSSK